MSSSIKRRQQSPERTAAQVADAICGAASKPVIVSVGNDEYTLPPLLADQVAALLNEIAFGREVTPAPADLPIGTQVAAELLGVSRPWVTTLIDRGDIPSIRNGTKRRLRLGDVIAYRQNDDTRRDATLTWEFLEED